MDFTRQKHVTRRVLIFYVGNENIAPQCPLISSILKVLAKFSHLSLPKIALPHLNENQFFGKLSMNRAIISMIFNMVTLSSAEAFRSPPSMQFKEHDSRQDKLFLASML